MSHKRIFLTLFSRRGMLPCSPHKGDENNVFCRNANRHFLGDYGIWESPIGDAFFFRGERSIDWKYGCPESIIPKVSRFTHFMGEELRPSKTSFFLEAALKYHRPKVWAFGHYHTSFDAVIDGTRFICLDELETLTLEKV